jgi:hypothetical protein
MSWCLRPGGASASPGAGGMRGRTGGGRTRKAGPALQGRTRLRAFGSASQYRLGAGRPLPGFGVGWSPEEYRAAGLDFTRRGARMEELLDALHAIWTTDPAQYEGDQISVPEHHSPLKPARQPRPPFYLGAPSERALRRVARRGDGWLPLIVLPSYVDVDGLVAQRSLLDELARQAGRDPHAIDAGTSTEKVAGTVKEVHERTGIDHFMIDSMYNVDTVEGSLEHALQILELVKKGGAFSLWSDRGGDLGDVVVRLETDGVQELTPGRPARFQGSDERVRPAGYELVRGLSVAAVDVTEQTVRAGGGVGAEPVADVDGEDQAAVDCLRHGQVGQHLPQPGHVHVPAVQCVVHRAVPAPVLGHQRQVDRCRQLGMTSAGKPAEALCAHRALHESPKVRTHGIGLLQPGLVPSALDPRQRKIEPERE